VSAQPCTTTYATTRHLSVNLGTLPGPHGIGRCGSTLCGFRAYDEVAASENIGRDVNLAALAPCGRCARSTARLARNAAS